MRCSTRAPELERLFATGALRLRPTRHPSLVELHLCGNPLPHPVVEALGRCELPALERLALMLSSDAGDGADALLLDALDGLRAPKLTEVHLTSVDDVCCFLAQIVERGLTRRWKVLTLSGTWDGAVEDRELLPVLAVHGRELRNLHTLGLPVEDVLPSAKALAPCVADLSGLEKMHLPSVYADW